MNKEQIEHIKSVLPLFQSVFGRDTVEEYAEEYNSKYRKGELYLRLCEDLNLEPKVWIVGSNPAGTDS